MRYALVLGGAACVWRDVEAALEAGQYSGVVACNDAGAAWPGELDAIVSLHPEKFPLWAERRVRAGHKLPPRFYSHREPSGGRHSFVTHQTDWKFKGQVETGSSALFALKVALIDLGFDRAVVCGVPMDATPHFFDEAAWRGARSHMQGWREAFPEIKHRARAMSGFTADLLGKPDEEWLGA